MLRYRTRNRSIDVGTTFQGVLYPASVNVVDEMWDEVTPGFFSKTRKGEPLPVNQLKQVFRDVRDAGDVTTAYRTQGTLQECTGNANTLYSWSGKVGYWIRRRNGASYAFPSTPLYHLSSLPSANQLLPEAMAEARLKDTDVLTMLIEFRKTAELILRAKARTLERAEKISSALRRRRRWDVAVPRNARNGAFLLRMRKEATARTNRAWDDAFWNSWMEDRYGWRILAYDLESLHETYLKWQSGVGSVVRSRATETVSSAPVTVSSSVPGFAAGGGYKSVSGCTESLTTVTESRRTVGLGYEFAVNSLVTVDPLVTLLEIIPFSFIADWFTNIGDIVRGYSPFGGGSIRWAYMTTETSNVMDATVTYQYLWKNRYNQYVGWCPGATSHYESASTLRERSPLTTVDDLKPAIRFFNDLDVLKVMDIIGVLRGLGPGLKLFCRI